MTKRHKVFTSKPKVETPVTFELDGELFTARPAIPGAMLLDFIADADSNDGGRAAEALIEFMTKVLVAEDRERFVDLIHDEERVIEIELIADICEYLVSEYASRPTASSKASVDGPSTSGSGSMESTPVVE